MDDAKDPQDQQKDQDSSEAGSDIHCWPPFLSVWTAMRGAEFRSLP